MRIFAESDSAGINSAPNRFEGMLADVKGWTAGQVSL